MQKRLEEVEELLSQRDQEKDDHLTKIKILEEGKI